MLLNALTTLQEMKLDFRIRNLGNRGSSSGNGVTFSISHSETFYLLNPVSLLSSESVRDVVFKTGMPVSYSFRNTESSDFL